MASYLFLFILCLLNISSGSCSCIKPESCSFCSTWDHYQNKVLYQVVCQDSNLTSIPKDLPSFLGNFIANFNHITNITKSSFAVYPYLKILRLGHNHIANVEDGSFINQELMEELFFNFNNIKRIDAGTFKGLKRLKRLNLRRNIIIHLPKKVFSGLYSLTTLELGDNRISTMDKEAFDGLANLESLYLGGNLLKNLSQDTTFGNLLSLTMLDISFNPIEEIYKNSFQGLSNLEVLHINDCKLKKLLGQEPQFKGLDKLKELDLSTNPLLFLPSNTFKYLLKLMSLNLSSTNISVLHNGTFNSLTSLKKLILNNNPFLCDCMLKWMSQWIQHYVNDSNLIQMEMKKSTRCAKPSKLAGKRLDSLSPSVLLCSCDTCRKNTGCIQKAIKNSMCNCNSSWVGYSCDLVCNATQRQDTTCSSINKTCYCSSYPLQHVRNNSLDCHQDAVTVNVSGILKCRCIDGFTGNGTFCTDINECAEGLQTCPPNAACNNFFGTFQCVCQAGFEGNGSICFPVLPQPWNVQVKDINSTSVLVTWSAASLNVHYTYYETILQFKIVGTQYSWEKQLVNITSPNCTVLSGLAPNTMYLLKVILVGIHGNRSPPSPIKEFTTKGKEENDSIKKSEKLDSNQTAVSISLAVTGSFIALALLILVVLRHRKSMRPSQVPHQEIVLDHLTDHQNNHVDSKHSYLNPINESLVQDEWEIPKTSLLVGEVIGEGEFGVVRAGTLMKEGTARKVAIKSLREHSDRSDIKDFLRELDMFKGIGKHPNIVNLIGACTIDGPLYIITEYVSGGTLLDLLRDSRRSKAVYVNTDSENVPALDQHARTKLALDVAKGMVHISKHRFVHRDLAARNVLVTDNMTAKITDFGLTRDIYSDGIYFNSKGGRLPLKWMSPESIQDYVYTTQSDVWSFGVLMWEIWSLGAMPYSEVLPHELLSKLKDGFRLEKPADCSNEIFEIMLSCWNGEPMSRPTFCKLCSMLEETAFYEEAVI